jgi:hypothetical protein
MLILSSVYPTWTSTGAVKGSLPFVRRALSFPPAWVLGGAASNSDILKEDLDELKSDGEDVPSLKLDDHQGG